MRKGHTAKQEGEFNELKRTFGGYRLTDFWDFVRLRDPKNFPYAHQSRLNKNATRDILQSLKDFQSIFWHLRDSYKYEILASDEMKGFLEQVFMYHDVIEKKQKEEKKIQKKTNEKMESEVKPEELFSIALYNRFLIMSIDGLISSMPEEFQIYLRKEIKPFLELMISIGRYSQKVEHKSKIPIIHLPYTFNDRSFGMDITAGHL